MDRSFWPNYLAEHRHPVNRALHVAGTLGAAALLARGIARRDVRPILAAPLVGYGLAWLGHMLVEGNRPVTFRTPLKALAADVRMAGLAVTGGLEREFRRWGIPSGPDVTVRRVDHRQSKQEKAPLP